MIYEKLIHNQVDYLQKCNELIFIIQLLLTTQQKMSSAQQVTVKQNKNQKIMQLKLKHEQELSKTNIQSKKLKLQLQTIKQQMKNSQQRKLKKEIENMKINIIKYILAILLITATFFFYLQYRQQIMKLKYQKEINSLQKSFQEKIQNKENICENEINNLKESFQEKENIYKNEIDSLKQSFKEKNQNKENLYKNEINSLKKSFQEKIMYKETIYKNQINSLKQSFKEKNQNKEARCKDIISSIQKEWQTQVQNLITLCNLATQNKVMEERLHYQSIEAGKGFFHRIFQALAGSDSGQMAYRR